MWLMGGSMRPWMSPNPRHENRRAGRRTRQLHETLRQPSGPRQGRRAPDEKRRALGRLLDRYIRRSRSTLLSLVLLAGVVFFVRGTWRAMAVSGTLVPFDDARDEYDRLAVAARAACEEDACAWGWHSPGRPPSEVAHWMAKVRARSVRFHRAGNRTLIWPGYPRGAHLIHMEGLDADRIRFETSLAYRDSLRRLGGEPRPGPPLVPLGDGWYRVPNGRS